MSGLKISKKQYAHLIRDIEKQIKSHLSGGGANDFGAPDSLEFLARHPLSALPFFVEDEGLEGGGFFSSIGDAFKHVYKAVKKSGIIDKGKDMALKAGRELGGKAIETAAKKADELAQSKGFDASGITSQLAGRAHEALHDAEGEAAKLLDRGQSALEKKAGVSGSGVNLTGGHFYNLEGKASRRGKHNHVHDTNPKKVRSMPPGLAGNGMYLAGNGMYQTGRLMGSGSYLDGGALTSAQHMTPGIPKGAYMVGASNHLQVSQKVIASGGY